MIMVCKMTSKLQREAALFCVTVFWLVQYSHLFSKKLTQSPLLQNISYTDQAHSISLNLRLTSHCSLLIINKKQRPAIDNILTCFHEAFTSTVGFF